MKKKKTVWKIIGIILFVAFIILSLYFRSDYDFDAHQREIETSETAYERDSTKLLAVIETALWATGLGTINYAISKCLAARADYMEEHKKSTKLIRFVIFLLYILFGYVAAALVEGVRCRTDSWKHKM